MARSRRLGYGEGSIYRQRDGRWRGELRLGTKRRRVSAWTRSEVVAKLDQLRAESEAGLPLGTDLRLGEWLDWYQEMIDGEKNPSTCANCAWVIKQLTPLRGRRLRELDALEFEALLKDLANPARGAAAEKGPRWPAEAAVEVVTEPDQDGPRRGPPRSRASGPRGPQCRPPSPPAPRGDRQEGRCSLTFEQANRFVDAVRGTDDEALVMLALTMGLRPGEVTGLSWGRGGSRRWRPHGAPGPQTPPRRHLRRGRPQGRQLPGGAAHAGRPRRRLAAGPPSHSAQGATVIGRCGGTTGSSSPNSLGRAMTRRTCGVSWPPMPSGPTWDTSPPNELRHSAASLLVAKRHTAPGCLGPARSSRHPHAGPDLRPQDPLGRRRHDGPGAHAPRVRFGSPTDRRSGRAIAGHFPLGAVPAFRRPSSRPGR